MYTSCGWFFNDLAGIETVQILRYAARAIDLYEQLGEKPPVDAVLDRLAEARSNDPAAGDGRLIWYEQVALPPADAAASEVADGRRARARPVACATVSTQIQTCYKHTDRRAGVVCQRCDRPICPDCMRQASVGFHCPECTKQGAQKIVRPQQLLNARPIVTQVLIAINVAIFAAGIGAGHGDQGPVHHRRRPRGHRLQPVLRPADRRGGRGVVAARHVGLPARQPHPHRLQHVRALPARAAARAGAGAGRASCSPTSSPCSAAASA